MQRDQMPLYEFAREMSSAMFKTRRNYRARHPKKLVNRAAARHTLRIHECWGGPTILLFYAGFKVIIERNLKG